MTFEYFVRLLARVTESDPEYAILKNGLVIRYPDDGDDLRTVLILCESDQANQICNLATRLFPDAAPAIHKYAAADWPKVSR